MVFVSDAKALNDGQIHKMTISQENKNLTEMIVDVLYTDYTAIKSVNILF